MSLVAYNPCRPNRAAMNSPPYKAAPDTSGLTYDTKGQFIGRRFVASSDQHDRHSSSGVL
jgi:hypothetical protein